ncbi:histidine phosphatase superfamily [Phyllosticta capitalensis]|uniref:Histidine phosphatase superfamily n=1 Tax=Phyllosticta capitalensis TaxID=121624 RepID=A0ABR1Z393_9PEZI
MYSALNALVLALPLSVSAETVVGVYMYHRHGDRTPKALKPANLTDLGYQEVYQSGEYYRSRYVDSTADVKIHGLNSDIVKQSQIDVSAPSDDVLQNSAMGFLQGLYPPVGSSSATETLRNGTSITAPLNGYQLIPIGSTSTGASSEDSAWLQSTSDCGNSEVSSNNYFTSDEYTSLLSSTKEFYQDLMPVVNGTFDSDYVTFKNAYVVWDLINVAEIHNSSINSSDLLTNETLFQLRTLADKHEWGLAYNSSDDLRAMAGMQLAGQIVEYLNSTITGKGASKFGIQFGAYATFMSFFGLAQLPAASTDFEAVVDYASSMVFELFTPSDNVSSSNFPTTDDLYVRFLFSNGTASNTSEPVEYPLFGRSNNTVSWSDFQTEMNKFAVATTEQWCTKCGNTTGTCAAYADSTSSGSGSASSKSSGSGNGISTAVGGVIGAMVTLAVVLGLEALIMLVAGLRLVRKPKTKGVAGGAGAASGAAAEGAEKTTA